MIYIKKHFSQKGFALIVVLITLLILAGVVAGLLQNQTLFLQETSTVFAAAQEEQNSHNVHRACLRRLRTDLQGNNVAPATSMVSWVSGRTNAVNINLNGVAVVCAIEVDNLPALGNQWTPVLRLTSTVGVQTEVSELVYPPCGGVNCVFSNNKITVFNVNSRTPQTLNPVFSQGNQVEVAWHR